MNSVFRRSLPLSLTSLINKCGNIGLTLLPMLLIQKGLSSGRSSFVMSTVKACAILGIFLGGWVADLWGMKSAILLSFVLAALGLLGLPYFKSTLLILLVASFAQTGTSMFQTPSRIMIAECVEPKDQSEAFAWLRSANNLGQILSYSVSATLSTLGIAAMIWFDAATSGIAAVAGSKLLPSRKLRHLGHLAPEKKLTRSALIDLAAITMIFFVTNLFYDLYMVGIAGKCEVVYGAQGLKIFSWVMLLNCVFCTFLSVYSSRVFRDPRFVIPLGVGMMISGVMISSLGIHLIPALFLGACAITFGEIIFFSMSLTAFVRVLPGGKRQGRIYSLSLVFQNVGRIAAGALAFPWIVYRSNPGIPLALSGSVALILTAICTHRILHLFELPTNNVVAAPLLNS